MNREEMKDAWIDFLYEDIRKRANDAGAYKVDHSHISVTIGGQNSESILFLRTHIGLYVFFEYIVIYEKDGVYDYDLANEKDLANYETPFCNIVFKEKLFEVNTPTKLTDDEDETELKTGIQSWDKDFSSDFFKNLQAKCAKAQKQLKELIIKGAAESFQM
jgi:hypothetical protein